MVTREIALYENGVEYYHGKLSSNECYFRGWISKDVKRANGKAPTKFTMKVSNGKKKDSDEWLQPTFVNCIVWGDLGDKIADRYADKDEIEVIGKYQPNKYNGTIYPNFLVREVIRMKEAESNNPYPNGDKPTKNNGDFEEIPSNDDLPF